MGQSSLTFIVMGVIVFIFGIYYIASQQKTPKKSEQKTKDGKEKEVKSQPIDTYKGIQKQAPRKDMSGFIRFDKIANDMIYQRNGERFTMVIECKGINYELMSEIEQMAVEEGFMTFLNTLKFPIQLYVQTRSVDLTENIKKYKQRAAEFDYKRQEYTTKYNQLEDDIDASKDDVLAARQQKIKYSNIAEYVSDITKYVERLAMNKYLLQRKFYVILSYNKADIFTTEKFTKEEYEDMCYRELYTRAQGIIGSLLACSVQGRILESNELAELIYISLNKDDEKALNVRDALDSGFYRLYSTTDDVREKRQKMLDEEIQKESARRVEEAIREGIQSGRIMPESELEFEIDKKIDKNAIKMVEASGLTEENKEEIKNIIMEKRKQKVAKMKEVQAEYNAQQETEQEIDKTDKTEDEAI